MYKLRNRYLYILLLSVYSILNIFFTEGDRLFSFEISPLPLFFVLLTIISILWESNRILHRWLVEQPTKLPAHPLIALFIASVIALCVCIVIPISVILLSLGYEFSHVLFNLKLSAGFAFRVNLFLNSINAIYFFIQRYESTKTENEKIKKEYAEARLSALKSQVNPHFLFNNLNVLTTLVYKNQDAAAEFIRQLSMVYRYLLAHQDKKVVSLEEELEFIEAYIYLLKIRFQDNLVINNNIPLNGQRFFLAPVTLQLLVENAIKHNIVSEKHPLSISMALHKSPDRLVISNNKQKKKLMEGSSKMGLANLKNRYSFISTHPLEVSDYNEIFSVSVPLVKIQDQ